jgi:flavin-dependent dehydrogenase
MIDPFTGTGIQMALRTGEIAAQSIIESLNLATSVSASFEDALKRYAAQYEREFGKRMRVASLLRNAAFSPSTASFFAGVLASMPRVARRVLRATRIS